LAYRRRSSEISQLFALTAGVVVIATLYFARVVLVPFALAMLFSFLLSPLVVSLEKIRLPRVVSVLLVVAISMGVVGSIGIAVTNQLVEVTNQLPNYRANIRAKVESFRGANRAGLVKATETVNELSKEVVETPSTTVPAARRHKSTVATESKDDRPLEVQLVRGPSSPGEFLEGWLGPVGVAGIVLVFTVFMLLQREDLRNRFIRLVGHSHLSLMTQALDDASHRISQYLLLQFLVNASYGVAVGVGLHFIGLPNALLWGVIAAILRFLPYVGPPIGALLPTVLSLAIFDGWTHSLMVVGLFLVIETIVANLVEPILYGAHTGISSLAILVAAVFWTLLWGPVGLVLSTPLTVCLVVLGRYVPQLGFLHILLGDQPVLAPETHFYQRLLAADHREARQVLDQYLAGKSLQDLYDSVVIPALGLAERDRHQNDLDEAVQRFICQSTREMVEELGEQSVDQEAIIAVEVADCDLISPAGDKGNPARLKILCVPARDDADDIVATMLTQLLERDGHQAQCISLGTPVEMVEQVAMEDPNVVVLSALPPFALAHARKLYQKMRARLPGVSIIVGVWSFSEEDKLAARLALDIHGKGVTSLRAALAEVTVCTNIEGSQTNKTLSEVAFPN
jgi:predicted PurR-regulated permease PerM/methylmalonyl-CoA mutase cobalamin-binding subunit